MAMAVVLHCRVEYGVMQLGEKKMEGNQDKEIENSDEVRVGEICCSLEKNTQTANGVNIVVYRRAEKGGKWEVAY